MSKRGGYIVEAAIVMPIFIIAMVMVIRIIMIIGDAENNIFITADEMRLEAVKAAFSDEGPSLPLRVMSRGLKESPETNRLIVDQYKYKYSDNGIDDLIKVSYMAKYQKTAAFGISGKSIFDQDIVCRAFTGTLHKVKTGNGGDTVYIFPERGEKYHDENCTFLASNYRLTYLTAENKKKYHPCPLCDSDKAEPGDQVLIFPEYGSAYHLPGCKSVKKYYVSTTRDDAESRGYGRCSKCGG